MTDEQFGEPIESEAPTSSDVPPQYGVGPFTIREVVLLGVWLVAFVVSFLPVYTDRLQPELGGGLSVWAMGIDWILTIGVPTVAVGLIVLRRFSPEGIRRVGSLGIDQFASVAFSVSATIWLVFLWNNVAVVISNGVWLRTWVVWVEFFLMLAGVVLTVLAPFIPPFRDDFRGRPEAVAHRNARPVRAVSARPPRPKPEPVAAPADQYDPYAPPAVASDTAAYDALGFTAAGAAPAAAPADAQEPSDWTPQYARNSAAAAPAEEAAGYRRSGSVPEPEPEPAVQAEAAAPPVEAEPARPAHQAFWTLAPVERDVHDERGVPIFRIGPNAWALVIEDRGSLYVIRHEDGRIGYLHDVSGMTRG